MTEIKKYSIRFGLIILTAYPILYFSKKSDVIEIVLYKTGLALIGIGIAELVWAVFFKPVYGATEGLNGNEKRSIMVFRGLFYAAFLLAFTLGL